MQYFTDNNNINWGFEDADTQETINSIAIANGVTFTAITEVEYQKLVALPFETFQALAIKDIETAFATAEVLPVSALGKEWNGGYLAGTKYKAAYDLSELAAQTTVGFKDTTGTKHTLDISDAKTVLLAIGTDYLTKDEIRDDLVAQANAATDQAELDAIVISF